MNTNVSGTEDMVGVDGSISEQIRAHIRRQFLADPGKSRRLPAERELMEQFGVTRGIVRGAMAGLVREGLITRHRGRGTFVASAQRRQRSIRSAVGIIWREQTAPDLANRLSFVLERFNDQNLPALVSFSKADPLREMSLLRQMLEREVVGLLFDPCVSTIEGQTYQEQVREILQSRTMPIVMFGRSPLFASATSVAIDHVRAGIMATNHLVELGHKRIAHVGTKSLPHSAENWDGFVQAMRDAGLPLPEDYLLDMRNVPHSNVNREMGRNAAKLLLAMPQRPTAIFVYYNEIAAGIMAEVLERGLRIPEDLAIVGIGHASSPTANFPVPLSTIWYDLGTVAVRAVDELIAEIDGVSERGRSVRLPVELRPAASTLGK